MNIPNIHRADAMCGSTKHLARKKKDCKLFQTMDFKANVKAMYPSNKKTRGTKGKNGTDPGHAQHPYPEGL
eukprot:570371-Prorocentrum_lima.AAC.1